MGSNIEIFTKELDDELRKAILPYWINRMVDTEHGGFYGQIDGNNKIRQSAPKGSVLNARILWTFSAAYNRFGEKEYLDMADRAYEYCINHFINHAA